MDTITTGSIQKRDKKGRKWQITIELPHDPVTGKRVRRYKTVTGTKREAERAMEKFIREIEKGYYVTNPNITVTEWVSTWRDVYIEPTVSPTTLSRYDGMIRRYIDPLLGTMKVQDLKPLAVQAWVNGLKISPSSGKTMSAATIKHSFHVLKGAMDKAVQVGIIPQSPCNGIALPKGQKRAAIIYDEEQTRQLIQAAKSTEMELVIDMELCLGFRRGELLGLQWRDVDWDAQKIHIRRNRVVANRQVIVKEPKTASGIRDVPIPDQLMQKLKRHRAACMGRKKIIDVNTMQEDYIIVHPDGQPIYPEYLSQMLTKLQIRAGLPQCRFHDLRHLCATIMCRQNVPVKVAQEILGHKDFSTTMNIYSHVLASSKQAAADMIGDFVYNTVAG